MKDKIKSQKTDIKSEVRNRKSEIDLIQDRIKDLRENTDFVSTLFDNLTGYAIIAADFDGNILAYNEGARQIYGYVPGQIIGKKNIEIFFPKDFIEAGKLQEIIADLMENSQFSYEGEKVRKSGERFPAQILFRVTKNYQDKVVGFIEIVEDITERKLAAKAEAERIEQLERELHSFGRLSDPPRTSVTAHSFGITALREGRPDNFNEWVERYGKLLDQALEERTYKVNHRLSESLRDMVDTLGCLKAGPRDVVEIHSAALKEKAAGAPAPRAWAYAEEGRILILQLMGFLASYYRNTSIRPIWATEQEEKRHE